jgi:hypothetical protein
MHAWIYSISRTKTRIHSYTCIHNLASCVQTSLEAHPASYAMDTEGPFLEVKRGRSVTPTTHYHLIPRSKWVGAILPLPLGAFMAVAGQLYTHTYAYITHRHMYIRTYLHTYIHTHTHTYICIHNTQTHVPTYVHTHTHTHTHIHTHTYTNTHLYICTHTYIHTYMHAYIHTYIHAYIHTYIRTYVRTYIHTYIHTYVHTYTQTL